jgi:hypothetical protein
MIYLRKLRNTQRVSSDDNTKMHIKEIGKEGMDWIHVAQDKDPWMAFVNMIKTFGFHKMLGNSSVAG